MSGSNTVPGAAPTGAAPAGGYYSRPEFGADEGTYRQGVESNAEMVTRLGTQLQGLEKEISGMGNALQYLQHRWQVASAAGDSAIMDDIRLRYDELYGKYRISRLNYAKNYGDYERFCKAYDHAKTEYESYMGGQMEAYNQWRSSIRDSGAVQADLDAIEGQIASQQEADRAARQAAYEAQQDAKPWYEKLTGYLGGSPDTTLPTYTNQGAGAVAESPELKALRDRKALLQEEYEWAMYLPYADLMQNADFAEKSQYKPLEKKEQSTMNLLMDNYSDEASPWDDPLYEAINGNKEAIGWLRSAGSNYYGPNNAIGAYFGGATEGKTEIQQMTADEIAIFNYLHATEGSGAALAYFSYLQDDLNYRERRAEEEYWKSEAARNPVGTSLFSAVMAPTKGFAYLGQTMDYLGDGKIDQNAAYNKFSYIPSTIRQQVAQDIENSIDSEFWGKAGSFGYQMAMSMADFLVTTLASGGNSTLATIVMGSGAAADTVLEGKDRGLSDGQAFALGTIAGVAEALTEKVSLDTLLDKTSLGKSAWGYVFKNMAAESSEEVASSLINTMADVLISKEKSQWQMAIDAYMAQGKTEGQAFGRALADQALALVLDAAGGAISGGVMAGGEVAINKGTTAVTNRMDKRAATAAPMTFQEEVQRQVEETMAPAKPVVDGPSALTEAQVEPAMWQQGQRLAQITGRNIKFYEGKASENGFFDPKTGEIWVNAKGGDPLAQVFSHELTHSIEQAGVYDKLSKLVLNRMQDIGMDLAMAREAKRQQYQRQGKALPTQMAVDQELVAEYVSKHLLTNEQEIASLVQQDRGLGQKIHDFFDRLLAKLGNKNAQERAFLSKARGLYAKALRQTQGVGTAQMVERTATVAATERADAEEISLDDLDAQLAAGEITEAEYDKIRDEHELLQEEQYSAGERKYSIGKTVDNKPFVIVENDILDGVPESEWAKTVKDNLKQKFPHGVTVGRNQIQIDAQSRKELTYSGYTKWLRHNDPNAYGDKLRATDNADEILSASTDWTNEGANHSRSDKMQNFARGKVLIRVGGNDYNAEVIVGTEASGKMRLYDILNLQATQITEKEMVAATTENPSPGASRNTATISEETVSHDSEEVKRQYSLGEEAKIDSDYMDAVSRGDTATAQKMVDEAARAAGYSIKAYHGTSSEFTTFQRANKRTRGSLNFGSGFYFSPKRSFAENYTTTGRVIEGYLKLEKPYEVFGTRFDRSDLEAIAKKAGKDVTIENVTQILQQLGYDGIIAKDYNGTTNPVNQYVIFDANQVKSADPVSYDDKGKVIPLSERFNSGSNDIRYSLADEAENVSEEKPEADETEAKSDLRSSMPRKAAEMLKRTERELLWAIADRLSVPKLAGREYLTPIIQEMADEYLEKGSISTETRQLLFEKAYAQAVIVDAEFYEQYKHIKDHLRTTPVTISNRDKLDIADFNDFRKRAFGSLKIVNEGGLPVDAAYQELQSMAPELFPESITHPADQLERMFDASRSIQVTEKSVRDYFGKYEPEYRKGAQSAFEEAIAEATGKLWEVKRFAEEQAAKQKEAAPATEQEAMEAYQKLKKARRELDKVNAKNLLTESDQMQVGRLLKHEILPEHLKEGQDNVKGILAVFQAKQEYEHLYKLLSEYKRHLRGKARAEADELLKTANSWKDKRVGIAYSRETMERNVMDIIEDKALAQRVIDKYFAPVHTAEAASTRFKQDYRDRVRSMNISRKVQKGNLVSEAYAVQLLGEAQDNIRMLENARGRIKQRDGKNRSEWEAVIGRLWEENPLLDRGKIENAVKEFRKIYDELFQQMNQVRVANGYEPVNYRQGYFPHFQAGDSDSLLTQFGRALGIDTRIDVLPTTINGMTHAFKPGIQWFGNAQERLGFETAYDAVEGFDKYIEGVANVIHHTQNIQNLRAFASQIRYRTSDEGIRKQVDEIYQRQGLTDEEKQHLITEIYAHGKFALSGFVAELDEYTNLLAGKKSRYDRAIEAAMWRKAYSVLKAWESRVAANMIAGNLTSALTNFIPWTQAGAQVGYMRLLRGVEQTLRSTRSDDGFAGGSTFLTNRRGSDVLVKNWSQKASGILGKPMEIIDNFVSESIVRAAYEQNRKQGLSEAEAMAQADAFAASVMADRSKGAMPTLFHSTNPLMKAFTQFQLEVNNQFSEVFKDLPRRYRKKKLSALLWVLLKYFLGAWLYNELYEKLIGRRPALDPIGMLCQFGEDWKEDDFGTAGANLASDALGQLPFSSGLTLIGVETDGGRIPASSAVMDLTAIWDAATTEGWSAEKRWKEVQDELSKLWYVAPPFAGNQISKTWKGLRAYFQGGSYTIEDVPIKDDEGNIIGVKGMPSLQYPVYKDNPGDAFASFVKATILGKSSLGTAQEWVDKGFNSLGAKQAAAYQDMLEAGVPDREAYELIRQISDAKETDTMKKAAVQRDVLRQSQVTGDGKAIAYYGLMASEKEWAIMDRLADMGADAGAVTNALMDMADARAKDGCKQADVLAVISKAVLTDEEKAVLVGSVIGTEMLTEEGNLTQYAKFDYAVQNGMGVDQYIQYRASGASIDDYLELRDAGATVEDAMEAAMALQELKNSVESPSTVQKWKAVMAGVTDPERQMISLSVVMSDSQYAKLTTARGFGVNPADFVSATEKIAKYDRDGNGRLTQAEVTQGISNLRLTMRQKAVMWQLITGSSSAKNNPYSQAIGERVIIALEKAKAEGKKPGHSFQDEIMRQIMANMNP